jgi:pimeloyl-ACP methyl ester carboxylesterase
VTGTLPRLAPLRHVRTDVLEVAYFEAGPSDGDVALLLHGFPYDIYSYVEVIPRLAAAGRRVVVPTSAGTDRPGSSTTPPRARGSRRRSAPT